LKSKDRSLTNRSLEQYENNKEETINTEESIEKKARQGFFTINKINKKMGICIASTQPFRVALGAESRACYPDNTADRQTQ
jgi:hypothetical protein